MKKAVLFGAGQTGAMILRLPGPAYLPLCFADNSPARQGCEYCGLPVRSPEEALSLRPDTFVICVMGKGRTDAICSQLDKLGFSGEILTSFSQEAFDPWCTTMRLLAEQIARRTVPGDAAELGVFRGEFAVQINAALPDRTLRLFDTFDGFDEKDVDIELAGGLSGAQTGDFSEISLEYVR